MPSSTVYWNILNPGDTITSATVGTTVITNTTIAALVNSNPAFTLPNNSAGVPVLKTLLDDSIESAILWIKQLGTNREFGLEFIRGQPTTPPWQKPKP